VLRTLTRCRYTGIPILYPVGSPLYTVGRTFGGGSRTVYSSHAGEISMYGSTRNILIQGARHAGKTHLIGRLTDRFGTDHRMAGFFTARGVDGNVDFRAWDNFELRDEGPSDTVFRDDDPRVRHEVFERLGVWAVERALASSDIVVFDELGRFELGCTEFIAAVKRALAHDKPVVAALKMEHNPFLDGIRERSDATLLILEQKNRERIYENAVALLSGMLQ
jgi:nucleoside-triphosphatase THEP1